MASAAQRQSSPSQGSSWSLSAAAVEEWLESARPKDELIYARGPSLPQTPGVAAIKAAHDQGRVRVHFRRRDGEPQYLAVRRAEAVPPRVDVQLTRPKPADEEHDQSAKLRAHLRALVRLGQSLGTNAEIGATLGGLSASTVRRLLRLEVEAGRLRLDAADANHRIATLLVDGRPTGRTI